MKEFATCTLIAVFATLVGAAIGVTLGADTVEKKLGTAICKKLSGQYARLDGDPICLNPAGGVLKFYD